MIEMPPKLLTRSPESFASVVPAGAKYVEARHDSVVLADPRDISASRGWSAERRNEYITTRSCARRAIHLLGYRSGTLEPGPDGVPVWPRGATGSLTHCRGFRAAVVAKQGMIAALGLDAEPNEPLRAGVLESISGCGDVPAGGGRCDPGGLHADKLLFSAKEAVYKAWYMMTAEKLEPENICFRPTSDTEFHFEVESCWWSSCRAEHWWNRYLHDRSHIVALAAHRVAECDLLAALLRDALRL
jgi:4'-phosphopantetheinyl transferase EntD